ncbi:AAA family ATPase [Clostridium sp. 'deep sea']|uniref:AAA family ATPase n=1 Tax=Clostridium sp. 'deep sea' TaxID=2779445 RepID=UPI0018967A80|nr:AAA family ATPase [Clostridium sp. 'deep sea']QOR35771.1 AAA family ATPase [Clostridium sp. 'deep sea']
MAYENVPRLRRSKNIYKNNMIIYIFIDVFTYNAEIDHSHKRPWKKAIPLSLTKTSIPAYNNYCHYSIRLWVEYMNSYVPKDFNEKYENIYNEVTTGNITSLNAFRHWQAQDNNFIRPVKKENKDNEIDFPSLESLMVEMNSLVGLTDIRKLIKELYACVLANNYRKTYGYRCEDMVLHMVFKGNPGTGKTSVARILAQVLAQLKILKQGHMIEVERADLVGEYIGHTANKTREVIKKAMGGVLFIDEAYSLGRGGEKDFGKEAIDTLVKAMEDHKNKFVVILAGYRVEMESFMRLNPGLSSRFPLQVDYKDYEVAELMKIATIMYQERDYKLSEDAIRYLTVKLEAKKLMASKNFGNARYIRNLVEKSIRSQALRLLEQKKYTERSVITIESSDLQ